MAVTPDAALNPIEEPKTQPPSTAGMTTKVVKGSMWTLAGSVLPLAVSFIATPFIIRFLGAESYGVLLLVGLIPMYFSFADFGMGVASTRFASEAFGKGDTQNERQVVWTAATVALITSLLVIIPIFLFSYEIVVALNVPEYLTGQASIALKIASIGFVLGILGSVLNSPMLARLRMDLNTLTQAVPRILLAALTPAVLYFGGGIVGAVAWSLIVSICALVAVLYFSSRLLPAFRRPTISYDFLRPLLKFGGAWFIAMVAAMLLINLEKLFLTKMVSVEALAYYSVAFTFANMATLFSTAMMQSLMPAFSQLRVPGKEVEYNALFARSIRLTIIWLLPVLMLMFIAARPFLTLWAGEDFGRESTLPLYILLAGLFFSILASAPHSTITAAGRSDIFAKLYWAELLVYLFVAWFLVSYFGIAGAAMAWSVRVILDAFAVIYLSKRVASVRFSFLSHVGSLTFAALVLIVPVLVTLYEASSPFQIGSALLAIGIYALIIWKQFIRDDERAWISTRLNDLLEFHK